MSWHFFCLKETFGKRSNFSPVMAAAFCVKLSVCYVGAAGLWKARPMARRHPVMYSISLYSPSQPALISGSGVRRLAGTPRYNYFLTHEEQKERAAKRRQREDEGMNNEV